MVCQLLSQDEVCNSGHSGNFTSSADRRDVPETNNKYTGCNTGNNIEEESEKGQVNEELPTEKERMLHDTCILRGFNNGLFH